MRVLAAVLSLGLALAAPAAAQRPSHHTTKPRASTGHHRASPHAAPRAGHTRIQRSEEAKRDFLRQTGHPHGWPGHVVDHVVPLACGGADAPSNMQWQTTEAAKAKDQVERQGCAPTH